jgi:hypothetical protein
MLKNVDWFLAFLIGFSAIIFLAVVVLAILGATGVIQFTHDPNYHPGPVIICNKIGTMQICNSI